MNTLNKTLIATALLLSFSSQADSWFIKPYAGLSNMSDVSGYGENIDSTTGNSDIILGSGFVAGLSGGYYYNDNIAVELGWEYRSNNSETTIAGISNYPGGNYASNTFYLSGLYHFAKKSNWQPYIGGGLIWVQEVDVDLELDGNELSYSGDGDSGFQALAGINYTLNEDWVIQLEARYTSISAIDLSGEEGATGSISGLDYEPTTLQLGIIYKF